MEQKRRGPFAAKAIFLAGALVFIPGMFLSVTGNPYDIPICGAGIVLMAAGLVFMKRPEYLVLLPGL
jgi:hypothetical protein